MVVQGDKLRILNDPEAPVEFSDVMIVDTAKGGNSMDSTLTYEPVALGSGTDQDQNLYITTTHQHGTTEHRQMIRPRFRFESPGYIHVRGFEELADGTLVGAVWDVSPYRP